MFIPTHEAVIFQFYRKSCYDPRGTMISSQWWMLPAFNVIALESRFGGNSRVPYIRLSFLLAMNIYSVDNRWSLLMKTRVRDRRAANNLSLVLAEYVEWNHFRWLSNPEDYSANQLYFLRWSHTFTYGVPVTISVTHFRHSFQGTVVVNYNYNL
jgi:hypothetical protein